MLDPKENCDSILVVDDAIGFLSERIMERITTIETVKKIPEYNSLVTVEMCFSCAEMNRFEADKKLDDIYL